jgi:hypothetical protein
MVVESDGNGSHGFIHLINVLALPTFIAADQTTMPRPTSVTAVDRACYNQMESIPIPRSALVLADDQRIVAVQKWLSDLIRPSHFSDSEYRCFVCYAMEFFLDGNRLWCKDMQGAHKLVIALEDRLDVL